MSLILNVYNPVKIKEGVFYSKIILNDEEISIQVKKNKVTLDKTNNKALLELDSKTKKDISWIGEEVIKETSKKVKRGLENTSQSKIVKLYIEIV